MREVSARFDSLGQRAAKSVGVFMVIAAAIRQYDVVVVLG